MRASCLVKVILFSKCAMASLQAVRLVLIGGFFSCFGGADFNLPSFLNLLGNSDLGESKTDSVDDEEDHELWWGGMTYLEGRQEK